jgi:hypothetical protein
MQRDDRRMRWRDSALIAMVLSLALAAAGCSGASGVGTPSAADSTSSISSGSTTSTTSGSPSFGDKVSQFFSNSSAKSQQPAANAASDVYCPFIDIREGASTLPIGAGGDNAAMSLKYQGTFVRAARECAVAGGQMIMKVGIEGRVIVGPAGGPGTVDIPLRIAVLDETIAGAKPVATRFARFPVTVAPGTAFAGFTHIEEGMSFPMPSAADLDNYVIYIGFDPLTAEQQDKQRGRPAAVAKPKSKSRPTASTN